jgi:hypothetical protein
MLPDGPGDEFKPAEALIKKTICRCHPSLWMFVWVLRCRVVEMTTPRRFMTLGGAVMENYIHIRMELIDIWDAPRVAFPSIAPKPIEGKTFSKISLQSLLFPFYYKDWWNPFNAKERQFSSRCKLLPEQLNQQSCSLQRLLLLHLLRRERNVCGAARSKKLKSWWNWCESEIEWVSRLH